MPSFTVCAAYLASSRNASSGPDILRTYSAGCEPEIMTGGLWPALAKVTMPDSRSRTPTQAVRNIEAGLLAQSSSFASVSAAAGSRTARSLFLMSVFAVIM